MKNKNFSYSFHSSQPKALIFDTLLDARNWWVGIYGETITGESTKLNDTFNFRAGGGAHDTTQKLTGIVPGKKIVWQVLDANLSFLEQPDEWKDTTFYFELADSGAGTQVTFTHDGLTPAIECYEACSGGWMQYLKKVEQRLK